MKKRFFNVLMSVTTGVTLLGFSTASAFEFFPNNNCCYDQQPQCCPSYDDCCDQNKYWFSAEYLYWLFKKTPNATPLVTSGPFTGTGADVLSVPGTTVVIGNHDFKDDWHSGGRFALGGWIDDCQNYGAEVSYLFLGKRSHKQSVSTDALGDPYLGLPYINAVTGLPTSTNISLPGVFTGAAKLKIDSWIQGAEFNFLGKYGDLWGFNVQALIGFRWWNFEEHFKFTTSSPNVGDPTSVFTTEDRFKTDNNFYGGQIGINLGYTWCNSFSLNVKGKVALGAIEQRVNIHGDLETNIFTGALETFDGGYFAQPTNIGTHKKTKFGVLPEVNVNLGYQVTENLNLLVGYSFLYINKVARAGNQIDNTLNPSQNPSLSGSTTTTLVGPARPAATLKSSNFWAQGVNVGLEYRF